MLSNKTRDKIKEHFAKHIENDLYIHHQMSTSMDLEVNFYSLKLTQLILQY